mgnify:CR=1 FL=1|tara:strand:- start:2573 stop:3082 length:510 start_codon:yes stop_codon:yes gene_type:complete
MDSTITTWSGRKFNFLNPEPTSIVIEDIAHALSLQCRFNGHSTEFYSVAEHSVGVCRLVESLGEDRNTVMTALLHDAAEAYLGDVVSPLKQKLPDYRGFEGVVEAAVAAKFSLIYPFPKVVHVADKELLHREFGSLHPFNATTTMSCLSPKDAEQLFLDEFRRVWGDGI